MHTPELARRRLMTMLAAGAAGLAGTPQAQAAPTTAFERSVEVGGVTLPLNGAGTRYRFAFKVYDMALYTARKVTTPATLLALPGPKRLQFVALRELPGTDLGRLFLRGMGDNASAEQMTRHALATTRLIDVFSGRAKLAAGDTFAMEFEPGKGTTFYIQGKPQGTPVGNDEFFTLVLKIWVGDAPADHLLRDALLDRSRD